MPDVDSKICSGCNANLPLDNFSKSKSGRLGLQSQCKACVSAYGKEWYLRKKEAEPDYFNEKSRRRRESDRAWRHANKDRIAGYARAWREANPEEARRRSQAYYAKHRDRILESNRRWYWDNREYRLDSCRKYQAAHKGMRREVARRRRARMSSTAVVDFSEGELALRMAYFGEKCWMCGGPFEEVDHVKPLVKGGPHMLSNLRPSCLKCNRSKGAKWPLEELNFK